MVSSYSNYQLYFSNDSITSRPNQVEGFIETLKSHEILIKIKIK